MSSRPHHSPLGSISMFIPTEMFPNGDNASIFSENCSFSVFCYDIITKNIKRNAIYFRRMTMEFLHNLIANSGMNDWNATSSVFAFFLIGTYYIDRLICFDKCLYRRYSKSKICFSKCVRMGRYLLLYAKSIIKNRFFRRRYSFSYRLGTYHYFWESLFKESGGS